MDTPQELPRMTTVYRLPAEVYDQWVEELEKETGQLLKLSELFAKPSPFKEGCE